MTQPHWVEALLFDNARHTDHSTVPFLLQAIRSTQAIASICNELQNIHVCRPAAGVVMADVHNGSMFAGCAVLQVYCHPKQAT
jgi:hypothetical protein